ncbi:hypothetical protein ABVK25_001926 [Lepraria finkii]|uniref:Uncharacterized protein n=1 Tax=Lepraria finkii TaxID=1340010 RepID=A0ABR4BJF3_9LECA
MNTPLGYGSSRRALGPRNEGRLSPPGYLNLSQRRSCNGDTSEGTVWRRKTVPKIRWMGEDANACRREASRRILAWSIMKGIHQYSGDEARQRKTSDYLRRPVDQRWRFSCSGL